MVHLVTNDGVPNGLVISLTTRSDHWLCTKNILLFTSNSLPGYQAFIRPLARICGGCAIQFTISALNVSYPTSFALPEKDTLFCVVLKSSQVKLRKVNWDRAIVVSLVIDKSLSLDTEQFSLFVVYF